MVPAALKRVGKGMNDRMKFTKMHGCGNDYVYVNCLEETVKHPDKVVCVEECGPNVLKIIFAMNNIRIYMSRPTLTEIPDDAEIRFNDSEVVTGSRGYNVWWSKEYERREAHDL